MNLDATLFTVTELNDFAVLAERSSVVIRVKNTENLTINNLKEIAKLGRGKVIFEFKKNVISFISKPLKELFL